MGKLGDLFPKSEKQKYIGRQLQPGQVLYLFSGFTSPPKEKFLVLACPGTKPLLFVINSKVHPFIANRPDLLRCQVKLSASDYDFLDHDSFINCGEVIDYFELKKVQEQVLADVGRIRGELNTVTKREIIRVVKGARTISKRHKKLIVNALRRGLETT